MIIETSDNRLFSVRETGDANLAHVWFGVEVKKVRGTYVPKAKARTELVRKAATRVVVARTHSNPFPSVASVES